MGAQMFREFFVRTAIGRAAMAGRDFLDVWSAYCTNPEAVGTLVNDQLAKRLVTRLCKPGASFLDVGAHIGSVMALVQHHDHTTNLIVVEAVPEKAERLRRRFPGATIHACAVGESDSTVSFYVDLKHPGYSSLNRNQDGLARQDLEEITVPLRRIDSIVSQTDVDVMKIDVEGAELGVLRGGASLVSTCRPIIMFESGPGAGSLGYTKEALWEWLKDARYQVLVPNRLAHDGPGLSRDGFVESHLYPRRTTNY
jgi:FkbM family methyltransferase